ncbi:uroporphyrinogen-III [Desulfocucumis palustris]|uniref:Uroporphyrinogen-III n=1 Tax=Desulfocucumis palustris TaxID=1898651 RepID=A0A2L2X8N9_9FIRM|nr:uroporphyrinogen decarboxylase family protein [Desulfocucumis palustris]GBF32362.1 uroporphyrinogen-III [Desulfocucumis palustris]
MIFTGTNNLLLKMKNKIPRGELWISAETLEVLGLGQSQDSLIDFSINIGADICFFSFTSPIQNLPVDSEKMGRIVGKAHEFNLACGVTVDGPFERAVREHGFIEVIKWFKKVDLLKEHLEKESQLAAREMEEAAKAGADLLILCDDIAYNKGLYFSPVQFVNILIPFYREIISAVKNGRVMGFHSDGNVWPVITPLLEEGFSVFSLEPEAVDLHELSLRLPEDVIILSGIKSGWLMGPGPEDADPPEVEQYIDNIKRNCKLILASSCGLTGYKSLERLKRIYRLADGIA